MLHNEKELLSSLSTAGKVTVFTTLFGVVAFAVIFLLNIGKTEFEQAVAQENDSATTSVIVLNTPPQWTVDAAESPASATSSPTNSGDSVTWVATAVDSNSAPYQLLICSTSATPTPGTSVVDPQCGVGAVTWAVSATTTSGAQATAATTTTETAPFSEREDWFAWVCDSIDLNARCNTDYKGGSTDSSIATSSPFHVNSRPVFTDFWDDSPADPGAAVVFTSTSSDPDSIGGNDTLQLVVCATTSYSTVTNQCEGDTLATSTLVTTNATGTYTVVIPTQDQDYTAYGYIVDEHGHEATGATQGSDSTLSVNNVSPTVAESSIIINGGNDIVLTEESAETTGFRLQFTTTDNNSCENSGSGEEVTDYVVSLYRSGIGSTTCDGITGTYNPNNCYPSDVVSATTWNLTCSATTTVANDCNFSNDDTDRTRTWNCTFPLWYVADPTDGTATSTQYSTQDWRAEVRGIDDDYATGTASEGDTPREVTSLLAFNLNTLTIPYGELEPGNDTGTLSATTSIAATGNVGLDERLTGTAMCETYSGLTPCPNSASSTIEDFRQEFATSELAYGGGVDLSSSTQQELEINVNKSTSTTTPATGLTYWGIAVPGTITLAGLYTGENTFYAVVGEQTDW